jgi:hypothetical protein
MRPKIEDDRKRLKIRNFRMNDEDWELLEAYFEEKRIPTATGIRMVLMENLKIDKG